MKNLKIISSFLLLWTAIIFTSCDNEPIDPAINPTDFVGGNLGPALFKADFSGATWNATVSQAIISGNLMQIVGAKANGESFAFLIDGATLGTYPANVNILAFTPAGSEFGYWSTNINNATENTGSITISNINTTNKTISGTFSFKGYWSDNDVTAILPVQFTNGVFTNVPYISQQETNDTFFAKVNGSEFVDEDILVTEITAGTQQFISVAAQNAALNSMTVSVKSSLAAGTYTITGNSATDVVQASYNINNTSYNAVSGTVKIISKTATRIKGTFSVVTGGATPFTITEGAFDVAY
jgi:hypothetical protein